METFFDFISVTISVLLALKLSEIAFHLIRTYDVKEIIEGMSSQNMQKEWPVSHILAQTLHRLPHWMRRVSFRFKVLTALQIVLIICQPSAAVSMFGGIVLFVAVWTQLARIVVDQMKYGSAVYLRGAGLAGPLFDGARFGPSSTQRLQAFMRLFLGLCAVVTLSYAALYTLCVGQNGSTSFTNIPDRFQFLHFIYFSIVTLATVGYGDISPSNCILIRMLVASEICAGFLILVVLITSVGLTFQMNSENE